MVSEFVEKKKHTQKDRAEDNVLMKRVFRRHVPCSTLGVLSFFYHILLFFSVTLFSFLILFVRSAHTGHENAKYVWVLGIRTVLLARAAA